MPKAYSINFMGGVNGVVDKSVYTDGGYVNYLDNASVRSGSVRPFKMPVPMNVAGASNSIQMFEYRGRFLFSSVRRTYTAEYVGQIERIYFTEYGNTPKKVVEGTQVDLGTAAPRNAPGVAKSTTLVPVNVTAVENAGQGTYTKDRRISYRIAFETEDGVQVPCSKLVVIASANNAAFTVSWSAPSQSIKVKNILVFGTTEDSERRIVTLSPQMTSYQDTGAVSETGEYASLYDQELTWQYVYTFTREVNGVRNESGPSPVSSPLTSSAGRMITFDMANDGFMSSSTAQSYVSGWGTPAVTNSVATENAITISSMTIEAVTGKILVQTATPHEFMDGEPVLFSGFTDVNYQNSTRVIRHLPTPVTDKFYIDGSVNTTDVSFAGHTVKRVVTMSPSTVVYQPTLGGILVTLSGRHTLVTGEKVQLLGWADPTWTGKAEVTVPYGSNTTFLIRGLKAPTGAMGSFYKLVTKVAYPTASGVTLPSNGDVIQVTLKQSADPTQVITGFYKASPIIVASGIAIGINEFTGWSGNVQTSSVVTKWIPKNAYIKYRSVYRVGDTGEYLKVKDVEPWISSVYDGKSTQKLGSIITSFYQENGVTVIYDVPPLGGDYLTSHYHMLFCIQDHAVRWTPPGAPDAWPQVFSRVFPYKPNALASFAGALNVLCENAVYRMDGTTATTMTVAKTRAEDGCIAPYSVQNTGAGLVYLSKRGVMLFNGDTAACITDGRIPARVLLGTGGDTKPLFFWQPTQWTKFYQDLASIDGNGSDPYAPDNVRNTEPIPGVNYSIRSFYYQGRYFMYWSSSIPGYAANTMMCIDLQSEGYPITFLGFKPLDVHVSENDDAYCLLDNAPVDFSLSITVS